MYNVSVHFQTRWKGKDLAEAQKAFHGILASHHYPGVVPTGSSVFPVGEHGIVVCINLMYRVDENSESGAKRATHSCVKSMIGRYPKMGSYEVKEATRIEPPKKVSLATTQTAKVN